MRKTKRSLISLLLIFVLVLSSAFVGCANEGGTPSENESGGSNVDIWSVPSTEKVLQNLEYNGEKGEAKISVVACKGEYESGQIIICPDFDVKKYNATMGELKSDNTVFPKENVIVNHELYGTVKQCYDQNGSVPGDYPDGIVPIKNAYDIGETSIVKNENQGLYVTFNVSLTQPAGVYKGSMEIDVDGKKFNIPVTLEVIDLVVSEENHMRSKFNALSDLQYGEMDSSQEMHEKYIDKLVEGRCAPNLLTPYGHMSSIERYVEVAYKYCVNPRFSNYNIPWIQKTDTSVSPYPIVDNDSFMSYLKALAKKSFETGCDLLGKAIYTAGVIDEPQLHDYLEGTKAFTTSYRNVIKEAMGYINNEKANNKIVVCDVNYKGETLSEEDKQAFIDKVVNSIENIPLVVTVPYIKEYEPYIDTWCTYFDRYDTDESRENYKNQKEKWWYGCNTPHSPYPTYHIEDSLVSARAVGHMMAQYDIVGNLYWATECWCDDNGYSNDYYQNSHISAAGNKSNGEGILFYPGIKYGIDGPISTLRFETVRDGNEDYELWYAIQQEMNKVDPAFDIEDAVRMATIDLYTGTQVNPSNKAFATTRSNLLKMGLLAANENKSFITSFKEGKTGGYEIEFYSEAKDVSFNGEKVTGVAHGNGYMYSVSVNEKGADSFAKFVFDDMTLDIRLGGAVSIFNAKDIIDNIVKDNAKVTATLTTTEIGGIEAGGLVNLAIGKVVNKGQTIKLVGDVASKVNSNTSKIMLNIYSDSDEEVKFSVMVASKGKNSYVLAKDGITLKKGINEIMIKNIDKMDWDEMQSATGLVIKFGDNSGSAARNNMYIKDVIVYEK